MDIRVKEAPFDLGAEANAFAAAQTGAGALVTFTGIVRDLAGENLKVMEIEHYPGMTEKALKDIAEQAKDRWELTGVLVVHRYGKIAPAEPIMMVATAAPHRVAAFEAAEFLMDYLKSRAPFWKKEITEQDAGWVESKAEDEAALDRWTG